MAEENIALVRAKKSLRDDSLKMAEDNNMSLKAFVDEALEKQIGDYKYSLKNLMKEAEKISSFSLYSEKIKKEFRGAPKRILKGPVNFLESNKKIFLFETKMDELEEKILKKIPQEGVKEIFVSANVKNEGESNKFSEIIIGLGNKLGERGIKINAVAHEIDDDLRVLLFVSYKKKGDDENAGDAEKTKEN